MSEHMASAMARNTRGTSLRYGQAITSDSHARLCPGEFHGIKAGSHWRDSSNATQRIARGAHDDKVSWMPHVAKLIFQVHRDAVVFGL